MSGIIDRLAVLASPWAYVLVGLLAALEASAFIGLFLPGELALLAGGYIAYQGRAGLAPMMVVAALGAVVGDSIGYEIGRVFGTRLRESRLGSKIGASRWERAEAYLEDHGGRAVFLGRFIGVLRALVPALAGASRMPYRRFLGWNALGGAIWGPGLVLAGYLAGSSYRRVEHYAGRAGLVLAAVAVVVGGIVASARWVANHPEEWQARLDWLLDRPAVRWVRSRYRRQLDFLAERFRPGRALGLALTIQLAILAACGWAFGSVLQDVLGRDELARLDGPVTTYLVTHRSAAATAILRVASILGSAVVLIPVLLAVGVLAHRRGTGWRPLALLTAAQVGSIALYDVIKPLVGRPRPAVGQLIATATGYSFPSGHATQSVAVLGALAFLGSSWLNRWEARVAVWAAAAIVVLLVGFSRVYLGVHWASDVVGGYALGALWLAALITTSSTLGRLRRSRPRGPEPAGRHASRAFGPDRSWPTESGPTDARRNWRSTSGVPQADA